MTTHIPGLMKAALQGVGIALAVAFALWLVLASPGLIYWLIITIIGETD